MPKPADLPADVARNLTARRASDGTAGAGDLGPIDTASVLADVIAYVRRFVYLPRDEDYLAVGLWILATHAHSPDFDPPVFARAPYLAITSPERECGKTQTLEVLEGLTARAWKIDGPPSEAVIFRKLDAHRSTLLLDEVDLLFAMGDDRTRSLVAMLNAGYKLGATVPRCVGEGTAMGTKDFAVFGPKALAGINFLRWPDTLRSRCVPIRLHRLPSGRRVERWRSDRQAGALATLRARLAVWAGENADALRRFRLDESELSPRGEEIWEPMLAIAREAGRLEEAMRAAVLLSSVDGRAESTGELLLRKMHSVFGTRAAVPTSELLRAINEDDALPFGDWNGGDGMTARDLAKNLKPYEVTPTTVRQDGQSGTLKGYRRADLTAAWAIYAPPSPEDAEHPEHPEQNRRATPDPLALVPDVPDVPDFQKGGPDATSALLFGGEPRVPRCTDRERHRGNWSGHHPTLGEGVGYCPACAGAAA